MHVHISELSSSTRVCISLSVLRMAIYVGTICTNKTRNTQTHTHIHTHTPTHSYNYTYTNARTLLHIHMHSKLPVTITGILCVRVCVNMSVHICA